MSTLNIEPLQGWEVIGRLYDTEHPELLGQDMLELKHLESDLLICVGWSPEEDANGQYEVLVLDGCEITLGPYSTGDIVMAAALARMLGIALAKSSPPPTIEE